MTTGSDKAQSSAVPTVLRIGTRGSALALTQTELVRAAIISQYPQITVEVVRITTKGDTILDRPLAQLDGKGLFVTEIEDAMRRGEIDCSVHSAKDLPSELPPDMQIAVIPKRADARDILVARTGISAIMELPPGSRVGTSSPRRLCQLQAMRPDLTLLDIRGNVDTRLRKLASGEYDALVLAAAGLDRLGIQPDHYERLAPEIMLPAVGQGALAIEICRDRKEIAAMLQPLNDRASEIAVCVERAFLATVGGGCHSAVAAYATVGDLYVTLTGMIGSATGNRVRDTRTALIDSSLAAACEMASALAKDLLERSKTWAHDAPSSAAQDFSQSSAPVSSRSSLTLPPEPSPGSA